MVEHKDSAWIASIPPIVILLRHLATIGSTNGAGWASFAVKRREKTIPAAQIGKWWTIMQAPDPRTEKYNFHSQILVH